MDTVHFPFVFRHPGKNLHYVVQAVRPSLFPVIVIMKFIHADKSLELDVCLLRISVEKIMTLIIVDKVTTVGIIGGADTALINRQ